jgi:hypothetical protein
MKSNWVTFSRPNQSAEISMKNLVDVTGIEPLTLLATQVLSPPWAARRSSAIEENGFLRTLQHNVPFQPAIAQFLRDERMPSPRLD